MLIGTRVDAIPQEQHVQTHQLSSMLAPRSWGSRGVPQGVVVRNTQAFHQTYDEHTLFYDAFYSNQRSQVEIILPKLIQFKQFLRSGNFFLGDHVVPARIFEHRQYDHIMLNLRDHSGSAPLIFRGCGEKFEVTISESLEGLFANKRVLLTTQKNEKLSWIRDWVHFHVQAQGADAVLIVDNGSTHYGVEDVASVLGQIEGVVVGVVVSAPLIYGPASAEVVSKRLGRCKFYQASMLNLMKRRALVAADAVLSCDVDELIVPGTQGSVFDRVQYWPHYCTLWGQWRFSSREGSSEVTHADHFCSSRHPPSKVAPKWVLAPKKWPGRFSWGVHSLSGLHRRVFAAPELATLIHCWSISTSWKKSRALNPVSNLQIDESLRKTLNHLLGSSR